MLCRHTTSFQNQSTENHLPASSETSSLSKQRTSLDKSNEMRLIFHLGTRLHRRFLSRQFDAIFVAPKIQPQNRTCKPGAIFSAICRRDIAGVSNMFETCCNFSATKIASSCRDRLCKRPHQVASSFKHVRNPCDIAATNRTENRTWFTRAILKLQL